MKSILGASFSALTLISLTLTVEAATQKKRNILYTQSYDYTFKNDSNVVNCVARASAVLAKHGLSDPLDTHINKGEQWGTAYGWSADGTETAEISCNRTEKLTILSYAVYSEQDADQIFDRWKLLKDSRW